MNTQQKIENALNNWEGTRMIEKHFGDSEEILQDLRNQLLKEFGNPITKEEVIDIHISLKQLLKKQLLDESDLEDLSIEWYNLDALNWPEEDEEDICLENVRIVEFNENKLIIIGGGDWQNGCTITIEAINGKLVVTNADFNNFPDEDIDENKFIDFLISE